MQVSIYCVLTSRYKEGVNSLAHFEPCRAFLVLHLLLPDTAYTV